MMSTDGMTRPGGHDTVTLTVTVGRDDFKFSIDYINFYPPPGPAARNKHCQTVTATVPGPVH